MKQTSKLNQDFDPTEPDNIPVEIVDTRKYSLILDKTSTTDITYIGKAAIGSVTSAAVWQIFIIDKTSGFEIQWADADSKFDNIWDNRTSLTYSL